MLIGSASLTNYAFAEHSNSNIPGPSRASSIAVVGYQPGVSGTFRHATTATLPAANTASPANQQAAVGRLAIGVPISTDLTDRQREGSSLEIIAPQAQAHIDYALNLAERGAVQSAQAEFIMALDLIADALDADAKNPTRAHARAIQAGLTAISETKDFVPADTPHNVVINLAQLAATHQTPVLQGMDLSRMTRAQALQHYHTYATQQLAFAGGRSAIASSAMYGLGRSQCVTTAGASGRNPLGAPNAMALYQAALLVNPQNYMASNELGVLMARYGDLDSAAAQLTHSLSIKPQVESWHNLATVYRRMGQLELAEQADREREKLLASPRSSGAMAKDPTDLGARPPMQWVDPDTFAASATPYGLDGPAIKSNKSASLAQNESLGKRLMAKLNPWPKADSSQLNTDANHKVEPSRSGESDGAPLYK
jgi:hypothetical protein